MIEVNDRIHRVLVVSQDTAIRDGLCEIFGREHDRTRHQQSAAARCDDAMISPKRPQYTVTVAAALQDGGRLVNESTEQSSPFHLVFIDAQDSKGWQELNSVSSDWTADPLLQIVICARYSDRSWADLPGQLGHDANLMMLRIPLDTTEVLQLARVLMEKRRLAQDVAAKMEELEQRVWERTRELEVAHHESESLLSAIASLLVGIDARGHVCRWNDSAADVFGIATDDAIGQSFASLPIAWKDRDRVLSLINVGDPEQGRRIEIEFYDHESKSHVLGCSTYAVMQGDETAGCLLLGTVLTRHRAMEQQLRQAQKLESIGQLAAGVAHEINTPMQYVGDNIDYLKTVINRLHPFLMNADTLIETAHAQGFSRDLVGSLQEQSQKLRLPSLVEQVSEALQDSAEGVQHVSQIVRAMKEFSHPGSVDKSLVDLNHALQTTLTVAKNEWKYLATLETCFDPDLEMVLGFPGELNQVFLNILVNAAHAIADATTRILDFEGRITIKTSNCAGDVRIEISDNGGGIPKSILDRIFDPFFTTKDVGKGTGQGLAIAHSVIVQKHGGRIWCEVEDGVGTHFFIELPSERNVPRDAVGLETVSVSSL